jgi:hypothetical protein
MLGTYVTEPLKLYVMEAKQSVAVVCGEHEWSFAGSVSAIADGWKGLGATFESVIVCSGRVLRGLTKTTPHPNNPRYTATRPAPDQLRPTHTHVALGAWEVGKWGEKNSKGQGYCAGAHADFLRHLVTRSSGLTPEDVWEWIMDTTNGNHAMVRELVWRHCHFVDCGQHLAALSAADLLEVPAFKAANDAGNALSVFIRGSQKRTDALARLTPLRPMKQCKTRFAFAFAQFQRLHALSPHLATMHTKVMNNEPLFNGEEGVDPAKTVATYKALYAAYLPTLPVVEAMAGIADRFLGVIARLGCDDEYTSSIAQEAFQALFSLGGELMEDSKPQDVQEIGLALQNSLLARMASHASTTSVIKGYHKRPSFLDDEEDEDRRLEIDARQYAARVLDPACSPFILLKAGSLEDVVAFCYSKVLKPAATLVKAPLLAAPAVVPESLQDLKNKLAEIDAKPKPFPDTRDDFWKAHKDRLKKELRDTWKNRAAVKALEEGMGEMAEDQEEVLDRDPKVSILDALRKEMVGYRAHLQRQSDLYMQNTANWYPPYNPKDPFRPPYGTPLGMGCDARYEFWPSKEKEWPLLFFCARRLLGGSKGSTCSCERMHSAAGRINTKYRGSLSAKSVEELTLAYFYMRKYAKEEIARVGEEALGASLDNEEDAVSTLPPFYFLLPYPLLTTLTLRPTNYFYFHRRTRNLLQLNRLHCYLLLFLKC